MEAIALKWGSFQLVHSLIFLWVKSRPCFYFIVDLVVTASEKAATKRIELIETDAVLSEAREELRLNAPVIGR